MGDNTSIEWTDATWNPVTGCTKVSPGCDHCYAERLTRRFGRDFNRIELHPERLAIPSHWRKPKRIFICSMSDLFHSEVPWEFIGQVFDAMIAAPQHTFQVLTKRPGRMAFWATQMAETCRTRDLPWTWPPNVWAGTSIESAKYLPRLDVLARVPAKVRFVSAEPLLGPLDLTHLDLTSNLKRGMSDYLRWRGDGSSEGSVAREIKRIFPSQMKGQRPWINALTGDWFDGWDHGTSQPWIHWVIVGGESGPGARSMNPYWVRSIRDQCQAARVPFFFKQWGGSRPGGPAMLDGREWREMPG